MSKASIAAVVLALGIVSLVQESTNAMVGPPAGLRPALTMPAVETVALRKSVTVTRHVAVRHRGVAARRTHVAVGRRGAAAVKSTAVERPTTGPSLTGSHWAPSSPPLLCRRRGLSTCAGIGPIRQRLAAIGTSANSSKTMLARADEVIE